MAEKEKAAEHLFKGKMFIGVFLLLILFTLINIYFLTSISNEINKKITETGEQSKPAKLEAIEIKDSSCSDCFDISQVVNSMELTNVNITDLKTLEFSSSEAKQLIVQFKIQKIPTLIISGELDKLGELGTDWETIDGKAVFTGTSAPYVDTSTGTVKGRISLTLVFDPSCSDCKDLTSTISQIKQSGISIVSENKVDYSSDQGKTLISKYSLPVVPILIFSKDLEAYEDVAKNWAQIGTIASDGSYILTSVNPPYRNLTTNKIDGLVSLIFLTDNSCSVCYDVKSHEQILTGNFGMKFVNKTTYDISSTNGKELLSKYDITEVPTVLLSPDASAYKSFSEVWVTISSGSTIPTGSMESDGWFVFRDVKLMGNYTDLTTGKVVTS